MVALVRFAFTLLCVLALTACNSQTADLVLGAATPTTTLIPVPSREPNIGTATPQVCDLAGTLKLGAVVSFTGNASGYSTSIQRGIDLAVQEINDSNFITPDADIAIVYEDDESDPDTAAEKMESLITDEEVLGLLGPTLSSAAFRADPVAQRFGVPVIGTSNTAESLTEMGSYVFRSSLPESSVIPSTLDAIIELEGVETVMLVYDRDDVFTRSAFNTMKSAATQQGVRILEEISFVTAAEEFDAIVATIEEEQPDLIMVSALLNDAAALLVQLRDAGINTPVMGGNGFNSNSLVVGAGDAVDGAVSGASWSPENSYPESIAFLENYRAAYDTDPDQFAAQSYTAVYLYAHAFRNGCSMIQSNLRNSLAELRLIPTPLGSFSFTTDRNPLHPPVVLIYEDGKQELLTP
jgi:branched-chain amino acid transport system substrate-binding protein